MSLYYSPSEINEARLRSVAREVAREIDLTILQPGPGGFLWVGRNQRRFGPAHDPKTGVRVICSGHLAWSAHDWSRAERLPYEGGLGPRLLLERYLQHGKNAVAPYNGSTIVIVHDPRSGDHHVYTDQFGYHPCFIYRGDDAGNCLITTFPDSLLADPALSVTWDYVTMVEFIRGWRGTPPYTYFQEVRCIPAATHLLISRDAAIQAEPYWAPFLNGVFRDVGEAAEALASAVRSSIAERTAVAERPLFFVSGGADSRVLLFSAHDPGRAIGFHIYEHFAQETQVARALCAKVGSRYHEYRRDNDYYPRVLQDTVRWTGGMWSVVDAHFPGLAADVESFDPDLVMTGCSTDWLFKGLGMEKRHRQLFGRSLPLLAYENERIDGFTGSFPLLPAPAAFEQAANERLNTWFQGCPRQFNRPMDRLVTVDRRIRPFSYNIFVSGQSMYRVFPYDTFMADSRIAECYSRIHPDWKLNREVWGRAAAMVCNGGADIIDSNYGWRPDAGTPEKLLVFAKGWVSRRAKRFAAKASRQVSDRPPAAGSWPDYGWYVLNSPTLQILWHTATRDERDRMIAIQGWDPWQRSLEQWVDDGGFHMFRLLTLLCHWRECDRRRERAGLGTLSRSAA
jgi:asparagine synthetase B (glutamine-hydrolysing)